MRYRIFILILSVVLFVLTTINISAKGIETYRSEALNGSSIQKKHVNKFFLLGGIGLIGLGGAFLLAGYNDDGSFGKPDPSLVGLGWALTGGGALFVAFSF